MKRTLILGASNNPTRYAFEAARRLTHHGHEIVPVGIKSGEVFGKTIINQKDIQANIHTITLYVGTPNQSEWYDYILQTRPKRLIFNPGTENDELAQLAENQGIETLEACTLVMLSTGQY
jgi:uncharacterized protein